MNWNKLSAYRSELMGIATLFVVVFHFFEGVGKHLDKVNDLVNCLYSFGKYGYIGVEVFLIISGMGCYYSLHKNNQVLSFYKRRLSKIIIPYIIVASVLFFIKDFIFLNNEDKLFNDLLFINLFEKNVRVFWYVALILFMYIITPPLYSLFSNDTFKRTISFILIEMLLISSGIYIYNFNKGLFDSIQLIYTRIPIYVFGVFIGKDVMEKRDVNKLLLIISLISVLFIDVKWEYKVTLRYINSLQAIGFTFIAIYLVDIFHKIISFKFVNTLGKYSYEIYLLHVAIRNWLNYRGYELYHLRNYILVIIFTIILTPLLNRLSNYIHSKLF
jgi:peptidoglycan/LPS O-acetylase OafA/YrhL